MLRNFPHLLPAAGLIVICCTLTGLANSSPAPGVRADARAASVGNVTDQDELLEIALNDYNPIVRAAAVRKLTDRFQIARIALDDDSKDGIVRAAAIEKIEDLDLLTRIAAGEDKYRNGLTPEVFLRLRTVAVKRIEDQALLAQVAMEEIPADTTKDGYIRSNAHALRMTAIDKLTDQSQLEKVALEGNAGDARKAALQKLRDPALLATVMHEGRDTDLRDSARAKLAKALLKAVTDGDAATVRLFASSFALDLRDGEGRTLLMLAAECGRVEVVKFLLDSGVDVNEENVIQDYVRLQNGAALYPGPTMTVAELASDLPGSVVVSGRIETALSLTSPSAHPETRELLIKAGAK